MTSNKFKNDWTMLIVIVFTIVMVFTYMMCAIKVNAYNDNSDVDIDNDYSLLMVQAVCNGDSAAGREYERLRNLKKERIGTYDTLCYDELVVLAKIVHAEAGSNWLTEEHRQLVASVVINRVNSPEFPNSIYEVVYQRGQYAPVGTSYFKNLIPSEHATMSALRVLLNGSIAPSSVVFQANFKQGGGVYKTIKDRTLGTTYFCYSNNRRLYK